MDRDISRWLRDDLGLAYMCDRDLNLLMFHPRHGILCRKLLKFMSESFLCSQRYPDVFARDDHRQLSEQLAKKSQNLDNLSDELKKKMINYANCEKKLTNLHQIESYFQKLKSLQEKSLDDITRIANRPNRYIEQVNNRIGQVDYLDSTELISLYDIDPATLLCNNRHKNASNVITAMGPIGFDSESKEEQDNLLKKVDTLHDAIGHLLNDISHRQVDNSLQLMMIGIDKLVALQISESNDQPKVIRSINAKLSEENRELNDQVASLNKDIQEACSRYRQMRSDMLEKYKHQMLEVETFSNKLQGLENNVERLSNNNSNN